MKVLIVEDEQLAVDQLESLLRSYDPNITVLDRIDSVEQAVNYMNSHGNQIDLVFLDIQLADGKSFEIFRKINYPYPVLFTTAYDDYALNAFKLNSIDYLLKPVKQDELAAALDKFRLLQKNNNSDSVIDRQLIESLLSNHSKNFKQRFLVKLGSRLQFKSVDESAYFSAEDKICYLVQKPDAKRFVIDHTLEELDQDLLDPKRFFRISRQHIVQIDTIKEIRNLGTRMELILTIPTSEKLFVSRNRAVDFKNWLNS